MEKGITSLFYYLIKRKNDNNYFTENEVIDFMKKMISAHSHLQDLKISHRDIKPENIIITNEENLEYKICDMGVGTVG